MGLTVVLATHRPWDEGGGMESETGHAEGSNLRSKEQTRRNGGDDENLQRTGGRRTGEAPAVLVSRASVTENFRAKNGDNR